MGGVGHGSLSWGGMKMGDIPESIIATGDFSEIEELISVWGEDFRWEVYFMEEWQYLGKFPIRQDITVLPADPPGKRLLGWRWTGKL